MAAKSGGNKTAEVGEQSSANVDAVQVRRHEDGMARPTVKVTIRLPMQC